MTRFGITRAAFWPPRPSAPLPLSEASLICFHSSLSSPSWISDSYFPPFKSLPLSPGSVQIRQWLAWKKCSAVARVGAIIICWRITKLIYSLSPKLLFHFVLTASFFFFTPKPLKYSPPLFDLTALLHWNVQHVRKLKVQFSSAHSRRSRRSCHESRNLLLCFPYFKNVANREIHSQSNIPNRSLFHPRLFTTRVRIFRFTPIENRQLGEESAAVLDYPQPLRFL